MKSLVESILSSTKTGKNTMIEKWLEEKNLSIESIVNPDGTISFNDRSNVISFRNIFGKNGKLPDYIKFKPTDLITEYIIDKESVMDMIDTPSKCGSLAIRTYYNSGSNSDCNVKNLNVELTKRTNGSSTLFLENKENKLVFENSKILINTDYVGTSKPASVFLESQIEGDLTISGTSKQCIFIEAYSNRKRKAPYPNLIIDFVEYLESLWGIRNDGGAQRDLNPIGNDCQSVITRTIITDKRYKRDLMNIIKENLPFIDFESFKKVWINFPKSPEAKEDYSNSLNVYFTSKGDMYIDEIPYNKRYINTKNK